MGVDYGIDRKSGIQSKIIIPVHLFKRLIYLIGTLRLEGMDRFQDT